MASSSSSQTPSIEEIVDQPAPSQQKSEAEPVEMSLLLPFVEQTQASGALSLTDAFIVHAAIRYLSADADEKAKDEFLAQIPASQKKANPIETASNVIISAVVRGQAKGAYSLSDAAKIAKLLKLVA